MIDPRILENEKRLHIALKERIRADDPDIDEVTLADTVEGLTDFHEILAAVIRAARDDEANIEKLSNQIAEKTKTIERHALRMARRREIVRKEMEECDIKTIRAPDFTVSLHKAPPHVVIVDEALIPPDYIEQRPHILKRAIGEALKNNTPVDGAVLSNPGNTLSVRTR